MLTVPCVTIKLDHVISDNYDEATSQGIVIGMVIKRMRD